MVKIADVAEGIKKLKLGFNRKKHLQKKAECSRCGTVVCRHMLNRHQRTMKCELAVLRRFKAAASTSN